MEETEQAKKQDLEIEKRIKEKYEAKLGVVVEKHETELNKSMGIGYYSILF